MAINDLNLLKDQLRLAGLRPRKALGQNFLYDAASLVQIASVIDLSGMRTVLEIGPGLGTLTRLLSQKAGQVIAVELDMDMANFVQNLDLPNVKLVRQNIMEFDFGKLPKNYVVVANIPYYATSAIIRLLLECSNPPKESVLLVQKEVAERIVAAPGQMTVLAFSVQYYAKASIAGLVEASKFYPVPKVDSAILHLETYLLPQFVADRSKLFRLIKAGFGEKRKQLKNALAGGLQISAAKSLELIEQASIPANARAQELNMAHWQALYNVAISEGVI